jgi:hypothetical protein
MIKKVFAGMAVSLNLFQAVRGFIQTLDPLQVIPWKRQVAFGRARRFARLWLPVQHQPALDLSDARCPCPSCL